MSSQPMTIQTPKRLPRYRRAERQVNVMLTQRDLDILHIVQSHRLANSQHLQALVDGSDQGILRRLQLLYHGGYLDRLIPQRMYGEGSQKMTYAITNKGFRTLQESGRIAGVPGTDWNDKNRRIQDLAVNHTLMLSHIRTMLRAACKNNQDVNLLHWREGRSLFDRVEVATEGSFAEIPVAPDAYVALQDAKGRMNFFLEADRGTMTLARFTLKLQAYAAYYREKKHEEKFKMRFFRVLTVTTTEVRCRNLIAAAAADPELVRLARMLLFTDESKLSLQHLESIFQPIWLTLNDPQGQSILESIGSDRNKP